jgi:hypothetical protein
VSADPSLRPPLERLLAPLSIAGIDDSPGVGAPEWLQAGSWRVLARLRPDHGVGEPIQAFSRTAGPDVSARFEPRSGRVVIPFSLTEAYTNYVYERWRAALKRQRGLSDRQLRLFYRVKRFIPRSVQLRGRKMLIRMQKNPSFPAWPIDQSVARLVRFYAQCLMIAQGRTELSFRWFWPERFRSALLLTHDVESGEGLRRAIEIADLEEERGFRSSFNIVADWYPIDWGVLNELQTRGFELGVHGVHHDLSMFISRSSFESQLPIVREMADRLGASGFRSPATHRSIEWLSDLPLSYDCSVPHSDPFEPQPGGCCSLWPFFIGDVVEVPYTLTQDLTLMTLLGHRNTDLWRKQFEHIEDLNGLAQLITHPDPGYLGDPMKQAMYVDFLEFVRARPGVWATLPRDLVDWWRRRDSTDAPAAEFAVGTARLGDEVVFEPPSPAAAYSKLAKP